MVYPAGLAYLRSIEDGETSCPGIWWVFLELDIYLVGIILNLYPDRESWGY